ncbi:MAG: hypothetical protein JWM68_2573 [Verrucomicrobiales bacterium]|nr:hypothetical protein [Verrucomicrobiales bacterium]
MKFFALLVVVALLLSTPSAFSKESKRKSRKGGKDATAAQTAATDSSKIQAEEETKSSQGTVAKAVRIQVKMKDVYQRRTPSTRIRFFVKTDSTDVPIITLGDILHFPGVEMMSARERHVDDMSGVVIDVKFKEAVSLETHKKAAMAINLWQPNLTKKEYPIFPTDGHTVVQSGKPKKTAAAE